LNCQPEDVILRYDRNWLYVFGPQKGSCKKQIRIFYFKRILFFLE